MNLREDWIDIKGYEGIYRVSSLGNIMSLSRIVIRKDGIKRMQDQKILSQQIDKKGYLYISLWKDNKEKRFAVARLVALNFLPAIKNKTEVNHKNGIRDDNTVSNLEWTDRVENVRHSYKTLNRKSSTENAVLSRSKKVNQYSKDGNFIKLFNTVRDASRSVNTSSSAISGCCMGKYNSIKGFKWKYA